jgi:hypothetical protein
MVVVTALCQRCQHYSNSHLFTAWYFYDRFCPYNINGVTEWHNKIQYFVTALKCDGNSSQSEALCYKEYLFLHTIHTSQLCWTLIPDVAEFNSHVYVCDWQRGFGLVNIFNGHLYIHDSWLLFTDHLHTQTGVLSLLQSRLAISWQKILTQEL